MSKMVYVLEAAIKKHGLKYPLTVEFNKQIVECEELVDTGYFKKTKMIESGIKYVKFMITTKGEKTYNKIRRKIKK